MSSTPTAGSAAPKSSGRCVMHAPTSSPPLLPPWIASFRGDVYLFAMSHSAAAMKSSKTFCFFAFMPASCHSTPYSPPPRRFGIAKTPPISIQTRSETLKLGVRLILNPP